MANSLGPCIDHGKTRNVLKSGYAKQTRDGKERLLHRIAYKDSNNVTWEDMKGYVVRHKCDNTRCINPEHLELGTSHKNTQDMMSRGRHRFKNNFKPLHGTSNGRAKLSEQNINFIRSNRGIITARKLAQMFGVSNQQISKIQLGKSRVKC